MICYSRALALIVIAVTVIDVFITLIVSRKSVRCFSGQQTSMAAMNGYIEEMLNGQKVIKIFCHEKQSKNGFQEKNTALFESSRSANTLANLIMPVLGQIGNLLTVSDRVHRGNPDPERKHRAHRRIVVAFLSLSKSFANPIQQVGQQISLITMAMAGARRIFALLDEEPEFDEGYVTLVNAGKTPTAR